MSSASAQTQLRAVLTTTQEPSINGPTASGGGPRPTPFGFATFDLNAAMDALTMNVTIHNIDFTGSQTPLDANDNLVAAHIHSGPNGPLPNPPGFTNSVAWGFFGNPFNDLFLDLLGLVPNPNAASVIPGDCTAFAVGVGGTCTGTWNANEGNGGRTLTSQLPNIFAGRAYINFHTAQNTSGEIRGAILAAVPEPSTYALMASGLLVLGGASWRRRRS